MDSSQKSDLIFEGILSYLVKNVQEMGNKSGNNYMTQNQIAKKLGISQGQVSMLSSGQRGIGIQLKTAIKAFRAIGGNMAELLNEVLDQKQASVLINEASENEEVFDYLIAILGSQGEERKKLENEIIYLGKQINEK